ncbi:MAG: hypothetical protein GX052_07160 [Syntrophomonadaceae bacterium]|jgi:hypothetical protein|nr:hypothetical protein [Syntrophomonadaceae bacterium]
MYISLDIVGLKLKEYPTEIAWRQTTNYAAAVRDMPGSYTKKQVCCFKP